MFGPVTLGDGSLKLIQDAGVLRVCASVGSRPYAFIDVKTQQIIGGDVDLAKAVIALLGIAKLEYVNTEVPVADSGPPGEALRRHRRLAGDPLGSRRRAWRPGTAHPTA